MARLQRWIPHDQRPKKATPSSDHAKKSAAPKPRPSAADRFWRKVDKGEPDECWLCSYTPSKRYGQLTIDGQIHALFDPEDRKLHAFEVTQGDGELVLTLYFWPGLERAKELAVQAIRLFDQALENGDFLDDGV